MNRIISTIKTPLDSVNDDSVIVTQIFVQDGQKVSKGDVVAEIETSKALVEILAEDTGYIKCLCTAREEVLIGTTLFNIYENEDVPIISTSQIITNGLLDSVSSKGKQQSKIEALNIDTKYSKKAQELITQNKLDKILFKNYQFVTGHTVYGILIPEEGVSKIHQLPKPTLPINEDVIDNTLTIGKQKSNEIKYLSSVNSTGLVSRLSIAIRATQKSIGQAQNFITSTPLPLVVHEVSRLLIKYPNLNSFYQNGQMKHYKSVEVGIAMDNGENGLKVGSITSCNQKNLLDIEEAISELSLKYNENKLTLNEINSATFTITDLFSTGVRNFHPLVNYNNSAVLGICGIFGSHFNLELSFDHRISSGLEVSSFLNNLKERIENRLNSTLIDNTAANVECKLCLRSVYDDLNGNIFFIEVANSKLEGHICSNCFNGL